MGLRSVAARIVPGGRDMNQAGITALTQGSDETTPGSVEAWGTARDVEIVHMRVAETWICREVVIRAVLVSNAADPIPTFVAVAVAARKSREGGLRRLAVHERIAHIERKDRIV
jgi:hypothetical protein